MSIRVNFPTKPGERRTAWWYCDFCLKKDKRMFKGRWDQIEHKAAKAYHQHVLTEHDGYLFKNAKTRIDANGRIIKQRTVWLKRRLTR